jgi:type IX secretion system PorP/SprF family membrane protein
MKMMRKIFFLYFIIFVFAKGFSQDPLFTNTSQSLVYLNPSFAGSNGGIRNQLSYRDQWPNLSGTYFTYLNSFDAYIKPLNGAIAVSVLHDNVLHGQLKTNVLNLVYAQHFSLLEGKLKIIPSLQASYFRLTLDNTKLNFGDAINPRRNNCFAAQPIAIPSQSKSNFDFSSGLLTNYKNFYFGTSVFHINQPDEGLLGTSKLPYRLSIHSSYNLHLSEKTLINFFVNYQKQDKFDYLHLNVNALFFKHLLVGAGFKSSSSACNFNAGYRNNYFVLSLGYDVSLTKLSGNTAGSWEFMASFNLRNKEQRITLTDLERW